MQVLTHEEIQRFLIQAKNDDVYELYLLALTTGMRRGEIAGLQWDDLNVNTGELKIQRQVFRVKGKITSSSPKTKSSIRTVKLPKAVVNILLNYKDSTKGSQWMFPSPVKEEDVPRDPVSIYKKMQRVLERADCKKIRFHDLRHTFATMALESGMDVKTLSAMIGHVSSATTIDIYSHVTPEMKSKAACNIDKGFGKADTSVNEAEVPTPEKRKYKKPEFKPQNGKIRKNIIFYFVLILMLVFSCYFHIKQNNASVSAGSFEKYEKTTNVSFSDLSEKFFHGGRFGKK